MFRTRTMKYLVLLHLDSEEEVNFLITENFSDEIS